MAGVTTKRGPTSEQSVFGPTATDVARLVDDLGFLAHPDLPDRPGPAFLVVALRPSPTMTHYDPEAVDYWVTKDGRGVRQTLTHATYMPRSEDYSWGPIRLVDRFGVSNEYMTFGGRLDATLIDNVVVVAFASPAPLLRCGGHSQGWDPGADAIGGFFARMMVAIDFKPGFEASFGSAEPMTRYSAFILDTEERRHDPRKSAAVDDDLGPLLRHERMRLRTADAPHWAAARALLEAGTLA